MPPPTPLLNEFPIHAQEKLRYSDTGRQGHINNAVFATMLETGRVEFLYSNEGAPLSEAAIGRLSALVAKAASDLE